MRFGDPFWRYVSSLRFRLLFLGVWDIPFSFDILDQKSFSLCFNYQNDTMSLYFHLALLRVRVQTLLLAASLWIQI